MFLILLTIAAINDEENRELFSRLFIDYYEVMARASYKILKNIHEVDDAIMRSFEKLIRNPDKILSISSQKRKYYLLTTVKNASIDICREKDRIIYAELDNLDTMSYEEQYDSLMCYDANDSELYNVVDQLPPKIKDIITMRYYLDIDNSEIARHLNMSDNMVRAYISRGLRYIKKNLGETKGDDTSEAK